MLKRQQDEARRLFDTQTINKPVLHLFLKQESLKMKIGWNLIRRVVIMQVVKECCKVPTHLPYPLKI